MTDPNDNDNETPVFDIVAKAEGNPLFDLAGKLNANELYIAFNVHFKKEIDVDLMMVALQDGKLPFSPNRNNYVYHSDDKTKDTTIFEGGAMQLSSDNRTGTSNEADNPDGDQEYALLRGNLMPPEINGVAILCLIRRETNHKIPGTFTDLDSLVLRVCTGGVENYNGKAHAFQFKASDVSSFKGHIAMELCRSVKNSAGNWDVLQSGREIPVPDSCFLDTPEDEAKGMVGDVKVLQHILKLYWKGF